VRGRRAGAVIGASNVPFVLAPAEVFGLVTLLLSQNKSRERQGEKISAISATDNLFLTRNLTVI